MMARRATPVRLWMANTPFLASLADEARFADVAEQLVARMSSISASTANYYVGDTRWHPNTTSLDYQGVKFTIYLGPQDGTNGTRRVIPGSHREPFHSAIKTDIESTSGVQPDEVPPVVFDSQPGDVMAFSLGLWNAAFGGGGHRRMSTLVYYEHPQTPEVIAAVCDQMARNHECGALHSDRDLYPPYGVQLTISAIRGGPPRSPTVPGLSTVRVDQVLPVA